MISLMTRSILLILTNKLLFTSFTYALELKNSDNKLELIIDDTNNLLLEGKSEAVRHKKVALFNFNVYKAKLFLEPNYKNISNLSEIINLKYKAMKITPMRSFSGKKLREAMLVSYEKNNINPESETQSKFLKLISVHKIKKDQVFYLIGRQTKTSDELYIMMNDLKHKVDGPKGFLKEVFSVWLGVPVDDDMAKLQEIIIK